MRRLTAPLAAFAAEQSSRFPIAHVETDYDGGVGSQRAVVWRGGAVVLGPLETRDTYGKMTPLLEGTINTAVRLLGVQRAGSCETSSTRSVPASTVATTTG